MKRIYWLLTLLGIAFLFILWDEVDYALKMRAAQERARAIEMHPLVGGDQSK